MSGVGSGPSPFWPSVPSAGCLIYFSNVEMWSLLQQIALFQLPKRKAALSQTTRFGRDKESMESAVENAVHSARHFDVANGDRDFRESTL